MSFCRSFALSELPESDSQAAHRQYVGIVTVPVALGAESAGPRGAPLTAPRPSPGPGNWPDSLTLSPAGPVAPSGDRSPPGEIPRGRHFRVTRYGGPDPYGFR